jgi:hypothetical protein
METKFVKISTPLGKQPEQPFKNASNLYKFAPDFHNKCQKMQLDLCIVYTQEANSCNAELGVKSAAPRHVTANS